MGEWDEYFRGLLGEVEWKIRRGRTRILEGDNEEKISKRELRRIVRKLKDGKAMK